MQAVAYSSPLLALEAVVIDTETTGLDARKARVVEIGAVRVSEGRIVAGAVFDQLVNPGMPIPPATIAVHGITDARVAAAPAFSTIAPRLESYVGRAILIGHTIAYDLEVLQREYSLTGRPWPGWRPLDVRMLARIAAPSLADHGLDRLCEWLGVTNERRHSALGDAKATAQVFVALLPLLRARNIRTLAEAEQASRAQAENEAAATGRAVRDLADGAAPDTAAVAKIDSFPYRHRVHEVMTAPPAFIAAGSTLAEAMAKLLEQRISSVLVRLPGGETGIVTERDILRAIHAGGPPALASPVGTFASKPLQTVAAEAFVYRAIGRIERIGFRHLGVRGPDGAIVGVVTTRNLLRNRSTTAIVLGDEIEAAETSAQLAAAWAKLPAMARGLIEEAVQPRIISAVISSEIRAMTRRAAQLAEARLEAEGRGRPPVAFAVMVLGSAGRGESQLAADQDNAIVYAEGADGSATDTYFARLGEVLSEILDAAGIPLCKGGVMARNRAWRMSVADWRATIDGWVRRQRPEDLLNVDIFFDAVPVHGDRTLADGIWAHAYERGHAARDFLRLLTEVVRHRGTAFGLLGNFRLDEKGRIDLKKYGLMPIFTCARVLSIRHDVRHRATPERLEAVAAAGVGSPATVQAIIAAQNTLLGTVLGQQLADLETGVPLSTRVVPARLDKAQRAELKRALGVVDEAVDLATEGLV